MTNPPPLIMFRYSAIIILLYYVCSYNDCTWGLHSKQVHFHCFIKYITSPALSICHNFILVAPEDNFNENIKTSSGLLPIVSAVLTKKNYNFTISNQECLCI